MAEETKFDLQAFREKRDAAIAEWRCWDCSLEGFLEAYKQGERDFRRANLSAANLSDADLSAANLSAANLSDAKNFLSAVDYLAANFEATADGYIAYKVFGASYEPNPAWTIESGAVINEVVNPDRGTSCGCGINVATPSWIKANTNSNKAWKVLIRWSWLPGVIVPLSTDGKIRCERVELIEEVEL
jgi:hypothetical protein